MLANSVRNNTKGTVSEVNANMGLLQRGKYPNADFPAFLEMNSKVPLDLYQARNAVRIAKFEQAQKYASTAFEKAEQSLRQAEDYQLRKQKNPVRAVARQAVQSAEDAREIAVRTRHQEQIASEQAATQAQTAQAQAQAQLETQQRQVAQQQSEIARQKQALAQQQAAAAQAAQQAAEAKAQNAQAASAQAMQEQEQLRARLLAQFNRILPTTDTPQGLMVNLGDVLFATAKSDLRPAAKESLAKFSGIVLNYPTLKFSVEGYTDSTGSQGFNQTLSQQRAESVRDYLVQQGVKIDSITATGLGESNPVANNSTAAGRQQNRRVEIIVSGQVIGTQICGSQ